jgi:arylsulfatase A
MCKLPIARVASLLLCLLLMPAFAAERRPNFVVILSDDHGWSQLSRTMDPRVPEAQSAYLQTPNIDRIGREGMRFTSGYAPAPLCTPTRRSILCGTSGARSGGEFPSDWVPHDHLTMPKALKQADAAYRTAHFGKWGEQMGSTPEQAGYDASDGITGNNTGGMPATLNKGVADAGHGNTPAFYTNQPDPKLTGHITDRGLAFMRESVQMKRPFYVQLSYYAVHLSIVCREETLKRYQARGAPDREYTEAWAAMLEELDTGVGRILAGLKELGIDDNTYVVFTADNGGRGSMPGFDAKRLPANHPLTGEKHTLYEGGIRVPFMVRGPAVPADSLCHVPVSSSDLLATFCDLAGATAKLPADVDSVSLKPLLRGSAQATLTRPNGALYFHRPTRGESAIRRGDYKLLLGWDRDGRVASRKLYLLSTDPREEGRDIAAAQPDRADRMQAELLAYLKAVKAEPARAPGGGKGKNKKKSVD